MKQHYNTVSQVYYYLNLSIFCQKEEKGKLRLCVKQFRFAVLPPGGSTRLPLDLKPCGWLVVVLVLCSIAQIPTHAGEAGEGKQGAEEGGAAKR